MISLRGLALGLSGSALMFALVACGSDSSTNTATVDSTGNVVGVNAGVTSISAEYQGATGKVDCTVGP